MQRLRTGLLLVLRGAAQRAGPPALAGQSPAAALAPAVVPWRQLATSFWGARVEAAQQQQQQQQQEGGSGSGGGMSAVQALKRALRPTNSGRNAFRRAWQRQLQAIVSGGGVYVGARLAGHVCLCGGDGARSPPPARPPACLRRLTPSPTHTPARRRGTRARASASRQPLQCASSGCRLKNTGGDRRGRPSLAPRRRQQRRRQPGYEAQRASCFFLLLASCINAPPRGWGGPAL